MINLGMIRLAASIVGGFIVLVFILRGFCLIRASEVGILTKNMLGERMPEGQIIARHGQVGVQAKTLMPGFYWRPPIIWLSVSRMWPSSSSFRRSRPAKFRLYRRFWLGVEMARAALTCSVRGYLKCFAKTYQKRTKIN